MMRSNFTSKYLLSVVILLLAWPARSEVVLPETLFGKLGGSCVRLAQQIITGRKSTVEYWEASLGRRLEKGEILSTYQLGSNTFIFRYDGQRISWEYYRVTGRGYLTTSAFYPKDYMELKKFADKRVLDVGCGHGKFVEDVRKSLGKKGLKAEVEGIDISSTKNTAGKDYFHLGDIRKTGLKSNAYDLVLSTWSIFSYEQHSDPVFITQALTEVRRILKPGGKLMLSPVDPVVFGQYVKEVGGLRIIDSGRQRRVQPDPATILTIGKYVVIEKLGLD